MIMFNRRYSWTVVSWIAATYLCMASNNNVVTAQLSLGNIKTRLHNVAGEVFVLSERALEVRDFVYDGEAPAVYFWADTNEVPSISGYRLYDGSPFNGCGVSPLPEEADGTVTYRVEFPNGTSIYEILGGSISLWCEAFKVSFGEVIIPSSLDGIPDTASGPDLECFENIEEGPVAAPRAAPVAAPRAAPIATPRAAPIAAPTATNATAPIAAPSSVAVPAPTMTAEAPVATESQPYLLGNLTTLAHEVTGTVYLISDHIIEIRGFTYDGEGPAAYFYMDTAAEPTANGLTLLDSDGSDTPSCGMTPLLAANGTDVYRAEFPNGTSVQDYLSGSFSVWCKTAAASFGEVVLPNTLPESVSAVDDSLLLACSMTTAGEAEPYLIGNLTTLAHEVTGTVYLISDHIVEIRGFTYDGEGPAAYFYMDTAAEPTANGLTLLDSDGSDTPSCGMTPLLAANGTDVYRAEFPNGTSVQDYLSGSFSVWCKTAAVSFGEVVLPNTLPESVSAVDDSLLLACAKDAAVPAFIATPDGYNCEPLTETFQVRWLVEDNEHMLVELLGIIDEEDYMSFGVSGSMNATFMINGDVVVADTFEGSYRARDFYMNSRSQCSAGTGVCPDTDSDGATDDVNVTSISGDRDQGVTVIRYKKALVPSDAFGIDSSISAAPGDATFIVWAVGPLNPETGNPQFHLSYPKSNISIEFGRDVVDNCGPIMDGTTANEAPAAIFEIPMIQGVTEFVANIGPSGGDRGYKGITGQISWGIAWYVNDLLAPIVEMERGTTYTFTVYGGDDSSNGAEYHPFYITTSPFGGYSQINATERAKEKVYAGVENIVVGEDGSVVNFTSPFVAPICLYVTTDATDTVVLTGTYQQFFESLDTSCKDDAAIIDNGLTFTFTPNETTPDLLYYHCVTHRNLGWKIMVVDGDSSPVAGPAPTTSASTSFGRYVCFGHLVVTTTIFSIFWLCS